MRLNTIQFLASSAIMASWIFIPNLAKEFGATNFEIGLIGAFYGMSIFLSSYIFGRASDMLGRRMFLRTGLALCTISFFLQIFANSVFSLAIARGVAGFAIGIFTPSLIAYVLETGGSAGKFGSYGSLGWAFGSLLAGLFAVIQQLFALSSIFFFITFLLSLRLPYTKVELIEIPLFPIEVIRRNFRIYLSYFLRNTGASAIWIIFPLFLLEIGASMSWVGILYLINTGTQSVVMRYIDRFKDTSLVKAGLVLSSMVFISYTFATDYRQVIPMQFFLAVSWSCLYVGSLLFMNNRNLEKATSLGMLSSVISISSASGPFLGGVISQLWGFHAVMYTACVLSAIGYLAARGS